MIIYEYFYNLFDYIYEYIYGPYLHIMDEILDEDFNFILNTEPHTSLN